MRLKTVLLLAYAYPPRNASGTRRSFHFAKYLPALGYDVRVVSAGAGAEPVTRAGGFRAWQALGRKGLLPSYSLRWISRALEQAEREIERGPVEAVISTSPPVASHFAAMILKRRHRLRWLADFRDPMVGNPFHSTGLNPYFDHVAESWIVRRADVIVANTDTALQAFERRYPERAAKFSVVCNGYDPQTWIQPAAIEKGVCKVIRHVGNLSGGRQPGALLASLCRLIDRALIDPESVRLELIGSMDRAGAGWWEQPAALRLRSRGCLIATGTRVPEAEARRLMASAHGLVLLDLNDEHACLQVPAKIFDYLQVGRPVLSFTSMNSPVERILAQSAITHFCIDPRDSTERVDERTLSFLSEPPAARVASEWFRRQFAAPELARQLVELLEEAAKGDR